MINQLEKVTKDEMKKRCDAFENELKTISTGRAQPEMVQRVMVEQYGNLVPLKQVASVTIPEPRVIQLNPFDPSTINAIMKGVQESKLGLNPQSDGKVIRINVPQMTEERRKEIAKQAKEISEKAKVALRAVRQEVRDRLKKDKSLREDELKNFDKIIQKLLDDAIKQVDTLLQKKEKDILSI
jgi:ribosome recycling factor